MMWGRRGNLVDFSADLPGSYRREDTPLARFPGRVSKTTAPFRQDDVTEFEPVEGDETDESVVVSIELPVTLVEWLTDRAEVSGMSVSELVSLFIWSQAPGDVSL